MMTYQATDMMKLVGLLVWVLVTIVLWVLGVSMVAYQSMMQKLKIREALRLLTIQPMLQLTPTFMLAPL